jgi:hypothetical protein
MNSQQYVDRRGRFRGNGVFELKLYERIGLYSHTNGRKGNRSMRVKQIVSGLSPLNVDSAPVDLAFACTQWRTQPRPQGGGATDPMGGGKIGLAGKIFKNRKGGPLRFFRLTDFFRPHGGGQLPHWQLIVDDLRLHQAQFSSCRRGDRARRVVREHCRPITLCLVPNRASSSLKRLLTT